MDTSIIVALIITLPPTITAIASLVLIILNKRKLQELHVAINSRLTELLEITAKASLAEGRKIEKDKK